MIHSTTKSEALSGIQQILAAALFAADKHASQRRKGAAAEPYVNHLLEVANLISSSLAEPDTNLIIAGLLHDVIEDAGVLPEELTERFGRDVTALVLEVTDDKSLPKAERKRLQVETAPKKSIRAQAIKIADKISNVRTIIESPPADWTLERQREYISLSVEVVNGLTAPNPALKALFGSTVNRFQAAVRDRSE